MASTILTTQSRLLRERYCHMLQGTVPGRMEKDSAKPGDEVMVEIEGLGRLTNAMTTKPHTSANPTVPNIVQGEDTFANKVAIVTGTNTEIGAAVSEALGQAGASVLLSYYGDVGCAGEVAGRLRAAGGQAELHPADLSRVEENQQLVDRALEHWGRLDVFVANAGLTINAPFLETTEAQWDTVANLNLKGSYFGAQAAARAMIAGGQGGRIIFSTSVTGVRALPNLSAYGITKAGLRHMASTLGGELGHLGITVNAVGIGATTNARNLEDDPQFREHWRTVIPTGRDGRPEDVANAVLFLTSARAAMVNGHTLLIDGGWTHTAKVP